MLQIDYNPPVQYQPKYVVPMISYHEEHTNNGLLNWLVTNSN